MVKDLNESHLVRLFVLEVVRRRKITREEGDELGKIYLDVFAQAGVDTDDHRSPTHRAVDRQAAHLMRRRLEELHPELGALLDQFLASHPERGRG